MSSRNRTNDLVPKILYEQTSRNNFGNLNPVVAGSPKDFIALNDSALTMKDLPSNEMKLNSKFEGTSRTVYVGKRSNTKHTACKPATKVARKKPAAVKPTSRATRVKQRSTRPGSKTTKAKNLKRKSPNKTAKKKAVVRKDVNRKIPTSKKKTEIKSKPRVSAKTPLTKKKSNAIKHRGAGSPSPRKRVQQKNSRSSTSRKSDRIKTSTVRNAKVKRSVKNGSTKKSVRDNSKNIRSLVQKAVRNSGSEKSNNSLHSENPSSPTTAKKLSEQKSGPQPVDEKMKGAKRQSLKNPQRKRAEVSGASSPTPRKRMRLDKKEAASNSCQENVVEKRRVMALDQQTDDLDNKREKKNAPKRTESGAKKGAPRKSCGGKTNIASSGDDKTVVIRMPVDEGYQYLFKPASPKMSKPKKKIGASDAEAMTKPDSSTAQQKKTGQKECKKRAKSSPASKKTDQSHGATISPKMTKAKPQMPEKCQIGQEVNSAKEVDKKELKEYKKHLVLKGDESLSFVMSTEVAANSDDEDDDDDEESEEKQYAGTYREAARRKRLSNARKRAHSTNRRKKATAQKRRKLRSKRKKSPKRKGKTAKVRRTSRR